LPGLVDRGREEEPNDVDTARAEPSSSLRHDDIVEAVAFAAERLLLSHDWHEAADEVLSRLGRAAGVSRAYVAANALDADGRLTTNWLAEWTVPGVVRVLDDPRSRSAQWEASGYGTWSEVLARGGVVQGAVADLPKFERPALESHGVVSLATFPVFVDGEWWGAIGFDDCVRIRDWSGDELSALRAAATVLGAAIQRQRLDGKALEAETRYRHMVDHSPDAILIHADGRFVFANHAAAQLLAAETPATLVGLPIETIVHPDFRGLVEERIALEGLGEVAPLLEEKFIRLDGIEILVEVAGIPVTYEGHSAGQIVVRDISRRKAAEEQLRGAEERYRALVEHIPAVVYMETPEGDPERFYISPQVEAVFGYPADEWRWTADFWIDHVHPDDLPRVVSDDERTNAERGQFSLDYRFLAADGDWRWIHDEASFLEGPDGDGFWQGFMLDITERKQVEEQLRDAELKFRTIVEQNEAIFYTEEIDPDDPAISFATYVAPGNTDLIGYSVEDFEEDPTLWRRIIHPDDRERVLDADAKSTTDGDRFSMEYRIVRKDGRVIWVQDRAALVRLTGKPPYWQGFLLDVTERKVAEEQLARALDAEREAARRLRALDEMKNTFLQAVSHDLRTPLAAILGLAVTLERGEVELDVKDARDLAGRIAENARKLDRLVTNLLDMDRLARGIVSPKLERVDVGEVVRRVAIESDQIERSQLTMDIDHVTIPVDASKIERIVENLLANTARHTPSNAHVWLSVREHEGGVLIKVEDSGVGVPAEIREAIFEPFQQGPDAPQHSPGVGVGLTLVKRFAELHGGRAWIEERPSGGASFLVFLPGSPPVEATA
jgi:PAS domain S-box-containing protein